MRAFMVLHYPSRELADADCRPPRFRGFKRLAGDWTLRKRHRQKVRSPGDCDQSILRWLLNDSRSMNNC
jgi:hypothetical protein